MHIPTRSRTIDKYHRILEAAVKVFAEEGFHQATVSQIAREAGVADGTIYLYFKNKDDILVQFFHYRAKQVFDSFRKEVDKANNAIGKLHNLICCHLEEFQKDKNMALVYQAVTHQNYPIVQNEIKEISKLYLDMVSEIIEQGQQEGSIRKNLYLGFVKRFILGAVDSVINNWLRTGAKYDLMTLSEPLVELFIKGIGTIETETSYPLTSDKDKSDKKNFFTQKE